MAEQKIQRTVRLSFFTIPHETQIAPHGNGGNSASELKGWQDYQSAHPKIKEYELKNNSTDAN